MAAPAVARALRRPIAPQLLAAAGAVEGCVGSASAEALGRRATAIRLVSIGMAYLEDKAEKVLRQEAHDALGSSLKYFKLVHFLTLGVCRFFALLLQKGSV